MPSVRALRRRRARPEPPPESATATTTPPPQAPDDVDLQVFAQSLSCLAEGMLMLLGTLRERWATFDEAQRLNLLGLVDDHAANLSALLRDAVGGSRGLPPIEGREAWKWSSATIELP